MVVLINIPSYLLFCRLYSKYGNNLKEISAELGRWPTSVRDKIRVLASTEGHEEVHHQRWTAIEDRKLLELVLMINLHTLAHSSHFSSFFVFLWCSQQVKEVSFNFEIHVPSGGNFWVEIAKRMDGRNYSQCRMRWFSALNPTVSKVGVWTPEENWRLIQK